MHKLRDFVKTDEGDFFKEVDLRKEEKDSTSVPSRTYFLNKNCVDYFKNPTMKVSLVSLNNLHKKTAMTLDCGTGVVICHRLRKDIEDRVELLIGFESADTVVYSTIIQEAKTVDSKMVRFNKEKALDTKPISSVAWLDNRFVVAHESGFLYIYNRNFVDQVPIPNEKVTNSSQYKYLVTHNKKENTNPISKIYLMDEIARDLQVSNDRTKIVAATSNGYIHMIDASTFSLLKVFKSWYGGLQSVAWSPDDKFLVSGGEDDAITIYSVEDDCVLLRGSKGHRSYVSSVKFDTFLTGSDKYRVVSVGQDGFMSIWDLDLSNLKEKELMYELKKQIQKIEGVTFVPCDKVPEIEADSTQHIHTQPIGDVCVFKDGYITFCTENYLRIWLRPVNEFKVIKNDKKESNDVQKDSKSESQNTGEKK